MRPSERMTLGAVSGAARRLLALLIVALLVLPAPEAALAALRQQSSPGVSQGKVLTDASKIRITGATPQEEVRIRRCVAAIRYPLNPSVFTIEVYDTPTPDMQDAAAYYEYPPSVVHLKRDSFEGRTDATLGKLLAHELGHMVDILYFNDADRAAWGRIRGYPEDIQWDDRTVSWDRRPAEDFAETFAALTQPLSMEPMATAYGPVEGEASLRALLAKHVSNGSETLRGIQTERMLNQLTDQVRFVTDEPAALFVIELVVVCYALAGFLKGFRQARLEVAREVAARRRRATSEAGRAPGTAPRATA